MQNNLEDFNLEELKTEIARRERTYKIREKASLAEIDAIFKKYSKYNDQGKLMFVIDDPEEAYFFIRDIYNYFYKKD